MYPQFFCFVDKEADPKMSSVIKELWDLGYMPFVDGVHKSNQEWFKSNLKGCDYRLYWFDDENFTNGVLGDFEGDPDLLVVFSSGLTVSGYEWELMDTLIEKVYFKSELCDETLEEIFQIFEKPPRVEAEKKKEEVVELPKSYSFRSMIVGEDAFYEIVKPNTLEPYVTMVKDYKEYPMDMFTNWFKCLSFGVSGYDAAFIYQLFRNVVGGELDLEDEFRKRVERVVNEDDEPRIWRKKLEEVIDMYQEKGIDGKRKRMEMDSMNKKV